MTEIKALTAEQVYRSCPPESLDFDSTAHLEDLGLTHGQERAVRTIEFGAGIDNSGFNLFVLGPRGIDRHALIRQVLGARAASEPVPPDWCYVYNFRSPDNPHALELTAGDGRRLRRDMDGLVDELRSSMPAVFESEEYQGRLQELQEEIERRQQEGIAQIGEEASASEIALISTASGFTLAPMRDGEVLDPEEYEKLSEDARRRIEEKVAELQKKLQQAIQRIPRLRKELTNRIRALNEEMILFALGSPMRELKERWSHVPRIIEHLDRVREDVVENAGAFRGGRGGGPPPELLDRYRVNLLVDNAEHEGAPLVYEDLPNHHHLVGRIEHQVRNGALYTEFSLIRAGALHRANGGYLVLDARRVLTQPMAWESLKRTLFSGSVQTESLERLYGLVSTASLQPERIPLSIKVVLVGERLLYYLLAQHDPDFLELFKVEVDLDDELDRSDESVMLYARMLATLAREAGLPPLDRSAVARMIEQAGRMADDQLKLTTGDRVLRDILMEAGHWAAEEGGEAISASHVQKAIDERQARADRIRRKGLEQIRRGTVLLTTRGEHRAQVNGLSVLQLGAFRFGRPNRITATARPGKGQVVDIEREVDLGGPIHSKGVMILSRFIASHYAPEGELSLSASLAFEQSYGGVDGDSASVAETLALLSAIADVPLKQSLAVTGSINQHGEVQAVGGINEKIEGFFDACLETGGVDGQGVLIPASNVEHLMLRADVREAIAAERFYVYPVARIEQAIELMTGMQPGEADPKGEFPEGSFNRCVAERLQAFAAVARRKPDGNGNADSGGDGKSGTRQ
jgi:lon-related putative ATP-dependent protease